MRHSIEKNGKVSDCITPAKHYNTNPLINILPNNIINKFKEIQIHISDIKERIKWNSIPHCEFSIKTATWTNNNKITPQLKAPFLILFGN